jgi:hypothetical protein
MNRWLANENLLSPCRLKADTGFRITTCAKVKIWSAVLIPSERRLSKGRVAVAFLRSSGT